MKNLRNYFKNFAVEAQCFIDQYGNYTVPELIDVLGEDAHVIFLNHLFG